MLKAGNAGSIPDDTTTSQPLRAFLNDIGRAIDSLNSLVVGLDAVENGYPKPTSLDISWNPSDRKFAARVARKFALEAVLVRMAAANKAYFDAVGRLSRFKSVYKTDDKVADKMLKIAENGLSDDYHAVVPALVAHWRNRIVHASDAKLRGPEQATLVNCEIEIAARYASLSITRLLCHLEENRPTLKDVSSLIAMSINTARRMDTFVTSELSKEDLDTLLEHYGIDKKLEKVYLETRPEKRRDSIDRLFKSTAPQLLQGYRRHYPSGL